MSGWTDRQRPDANRVRDGFVSSLAPRRAGRKRSPFQRLLKRTGRTTLQT